MTARIEGRSSTGRLVEPGLTKEQRRDLQGTFRQIFKDRKAEASAFLNVVDREIDLYRGSIEPSADYLLGTRIERLQKHAVPFANAVRQFNDNDLTAIRTQYWFAMKAEGISSASAWAQSGEAVSRLICAGETARKFAEVLSSNDLSAREPSAEFLAARLAKAFYDIFGERPSYAREGRFAKALNSVMAIAEIKPTLNSAKGRIARFGERPLKSILQRAGLLGEPLPRGRKPRTK